MDFACHSYGHYHMKKISLQKFEQELKLWNDEVVPLIGKTDIYVYPYGEWEILNKNNQISEKHKLLADDGFKLFCGVGVKSFISMFPKNFDKSEQILFMDRCPLDGFTLKIEEKNSLIFSPTKRLLIGKTANNYLFFALSLKILFIFS